MDMKIIKRPHWITGPGIVSGGFGMNDGGVDVAPLFMNGQRRGSPLFQRP